MLSRLSADLLPTVCGISATCAGPLRLWSCVLLALGFNGSARHPQVWSWAGQGTPTGRGGEGRAERALTPLHTQTKKKRPSPTRLEIKFSGQK